MVMSENNKKNELNNSHEVQKKDDKKKKWCAVVLVILLLLLAFLLGKCTCQDPPPDPTPTVSAPSLDPDAGEYVEPEKTTPASGVAIPGWGSIRIPANKSENITVDLFNPEANENKYYLTFEIRLLNDTEQGYEVLYTSGLVKPGLHIQSISLTRALSAGTYDAIIHVQPYRILDKTMTNNADIKTQLIVS